MSITRVLDVSFNKLTGTVPDSYVSLNKTKYVYFTGNMLAGAISDNFSKRAFDVSYNNFSYDGGCQNQTSTMNLFSAYFVRNTSAAKSCFGCTKEYYGFHINCGGKNVSVEEQLYDGDILRSGPSTFTKSGTNWALSNTGHFMDNDQISEEYEQENLWNLSSLPVLYQTARVSPLSMSYLGFCLKNGQYTVKLHFAEIRFSNNESDSSLGRSIFNVYIQGKLELDEFNLVQEAGGVGIPVVKNFTASVVDHTLEIRFYWAGKGTASVPRKGVYGPIISAISVSYKISPPRSKTGIIIGVVVAAAATLIVMASVILWKKCCGHSGQTDEEFLLLHKETSIFSLKQIQRATNNFDSANKIGEGGFGPVYKGVLNDGTVIAVKTLSSKSKQGNREFVNEIGMISALQHPHLVKLYGCSVEDAQLLLIYEYMENNSLARALFGSSEHQLHLDWPTRHRICVGIARGLAFLHEESALKIVHRDIKANNVLLDKDLNPKISDFGLAKLDGQENSCIHTRIAGTLGYMAPEYALRGYLTDKADVYSFGIVALEIVSGKSNSSRSLKEEAIFLVDMALALKSEGKLLEFVDPRLIGQYNQDEVLTMINTALLCSNVSSTDRPSMSTVVSMLEGKVEVPDKASSMSKAVPEKDIKQNYDLIFQENDIETKTLSNPSRSQWRPAATV